MSDPTREALPPMTDAEREAWAAFGRAMDDGGDPRAIFEARENVRRATALSTTPAPLDAAWSAAEAALPEGWRLWVLDWDSINATGGWRAVAGLDGDAAAESDPFVAFGTGPTPAAALLALAEKLCEYAKP